MSHINKKMDMSNPLNHCCTKLDVRECTFSWSIDHYSDLTQRLEEKLRSVNFSAAGDDLKWYLEHTVYKKSVDQIYVSFTLRPDCYDDLKKHGPVSGTAEVYITHPQHGAFETKKSSFMLTFDEQNRDCVVAKFSLSLMQQFTHEDEILILCYVTYVKKSEIITTIFSNNSNTARIPGSRLLSDVERCFTEDHFKDVTISVQGKQYRAHKTILAARSPVFDKMLRSDMSESKNNHIDITDIEQETFEEMLYYIYTGKVNNLNKTAFELLPVADKYDLEELRSMCEEVLLKKISTDNAARILILADTYRAEELKTHALRFIKENYASCEDFNNTEVWKNLTACDFQLMKDLMAAFCKK